MDAFDWFHLLTPLALIAGTANFLAGLALKPEYRTARCKKYSTIAYCGLGIGWLIMRFGFSFKSMSTLTNICIIGWLILMPSLLLVTGCFIARLMQSNKNYSEFSHKAIRIIASSLKFSIKAFTLLIVNTIKLITTINKRSKPKPFVSESSFDETGGGPHVFTKNPEGIFGEEYNHPSHDPSSPWSSR